MPNREGSDRTEEAPVNEHLRTYLEDLERAGLIQSFWVDPEDPTCYWFMPTEPVPTVVGLYGRHVKTKKDNA